jgi:hypothetical protein
MFVQVITGNVVDEDAMRRLMDRWDAELKPGATGYLGSTHGRSAQGPHYSVVRFASQEEAAANSARPEQGEWAAELEKCFDGPITFRDFTDVMTFLEGGSDDAGFVQVIEGRCRDRARFEALMREFEQEAPTARPDVIGGLVAFAGDDLVQVVYFRSEEAARAGEQAESSRAGELAELLSDIEFYDLRDPDLRSA